MAGLVYHWKHGWIPLTHAAALAKAHGNFKLAEKLVPSKRKRKTPQHILDYHAARRAQDLRFEAHAGGGISAQDTHTQEFKDYFGVGDHSTSGAVEERITFQKHLQQLSATKAYEQAHHRSYQAGIKLGRQHAKGGQDTATENAQYDQAAKSVPHEDTFDQGYVDGVNAFYEEKAAKDARTFAPINNRRDLAAAILALPDTPNKRAARRHIVQRARELGATDLLPKAS